MPLNPGAAVVLKNTSISRAGGTRQPLREGLVGRVCRRTPLGFCWVQFKGVGCKRVREDRLKRTTQRAPKCTAACRGDH